MEDARSRAGRTGRNSTEEAQREALVPEQISGPVPGRLWWELELGRAKPMGACAPAAGPRRQRSWALPCTMLLILLGSQLLVARGWSSQEKSVSDDQRVIESYLPATVEYALHVFNLKSKDVNAYRLVRIRKSWREQDENTMTFSMELDLRRTRCGKFDEDIDNCPFEESSELNNVRHTSTSLRPSTASSPSALSPGLQPSISRMRLAWRGSTK
nr:cystatin-9 isoform X1 [Equus caballus]